MPVRAFGGEMAGHGIDSLLRMQGRSFRPLSLPSSTFTLYIYIYLYMYHSSSRFLFPSSTRFPPYKYTLRLIPSISFLLSSTISSLRRTNLPLFLFHLFPSYSPSPLFIPLLLYLRIIYPSHSQFLLWNRESVWNRGSFSVSLSLSLPLSSPPSGTLGSKGDDSSHRAVKLPPTQRQNSRWRVTQQWRRDLLYFAFEVSSIPFYLLDSPCQPLQGPGDEEEGGNETERAEVRRRASDSSRRERDGGVESGGVRRGKAEEGGVE